jgi:hypothetical protein
MRLFARMPGAYVFVAKDLCVAFDLSDLNRRASLRLLLFSMDVVN